MAMQSEMADTELIADLPFLVVKLSLRSIAADTAACGSHRRDAHDLCRSRSAEGGVTRCLMPRPWSSSHRLR